MAEESYETLPETRHKKSKKKHKKKTLDVSMEVLSESTDRMAPLVGYFPSGFNPQSIGGEGEKSVRVFRHARRTGRLELVVSTAGSEVEFVGKSYAGEAAAPQICTYALGVLDKEAQTLKIVPVAANKIFRMEPRLAEKEKQVFSQTEPSEGLTEETSTPAKGLQKLHDLTSIYGTKKDRDRDTKWRTLMEQTKATGANEQLLEESADADVDKETEESTKEVSGNFRNIPPHDLLADAPERVYRLDEIIPKGERPYLLEIFEDWQSRDKMKNYPTFVTNRVHQLGEIKDEGKKERLACILSYLTHLHSFWEKQSSISSRFSKFKSKSDSKSLPQRPNIPHKLYQKFTSLFVDPTSQLLSTEKNELLIGYILVLTLFADNFRSNPSDISADLKMTFHSLKPYYAQLGCKIHWDAALKASSVILTVPLQFRDLRKTDLRKRKIR